MSAVKPAWQGTDTSLGKVLEQLKVLRSAAGAGPRSSVLDVIIVASNDADADQAASIVEKLATHHPCRAVVVLGEPGGASSRIDAAIRESGDGGSGGSAPDHQQVFLRVRGPASEHIPSLVDSLLLSDVATFLWWTGSPPLRGARFRAALDVADVMLLDSARFERPLESFIALAEVAAKSSATAFGDFHWTRLGPWREVLAQFFNPGERRGFLRGISSVGVDYIAEGRGNRSAAVLLSGWMASALRWRFKSAAARREGGLVAHFVSPDGHPVEVDLRPVAMDGFATGEITGVRVVAASERHSCWVHALRGKTDNGHVMVEGELHGSPFPGLVLPVPARADEALLSRLLIDARSDPAYPRALQAGAEILRSARN